MNPDKEFETVENELREYKPAEPGPRLKRRLESSVSFPPLANIPEPEAVHNVVRPPRSIWASPWFQTAAAAIVGAVAVLAFYNPAPGNGTAKTDPQPIKPSFPLSPAFRSENFHLTGQDNHVFDTQDDGIVFSKDEVPFRRVRYKTMEHRVFRHPETGAIFELLVPREDILIVPAETY